MNYRFHAETAVESPGPAPVAHPDLNRETDRRRRRSVQEGPVSDVPSTKPPKPGPGRNLSPSPRSEHRDTFRPPPTPLTKREGVGHGGIEGEARTWSPQAYPRVIPAAPLLLPRSLSTERPTSPAWQRPRLVEQPQPMVAQWTQSRLSPRNPPSPIQVTQVFSPGTVGQVNQLGPSWSSQSFRRMSLPPERPTWLAYGPSFHVESVPVQAPRRETESTCSTISGRAFQWSPPPVQKHREYNTDGPDSPRAAQKPLCLGQRSHAKYFKSKA